MRELTLVGFSVPSIVNAMGYSPVRTQLMTVPPYAVSFVGESEVSKQ